MAEPIRVSIDGIDDAEALQSVTARAREAAILELYRLGRITSGYAARLLQIERGDFVDLAASRRIPTIQISAEELDEEFASLGS